METTPSNEYYRRIAGLLSAVAAIAVLCHGTAHAQTSRGRPARIVVEPEARVVKLDSNVKISVRLVDAYDKAAAAPKPLAIELEVKLPSKKSSKRTISIPSGQNSADVQLSFGEVGIVQLVGRNPEVYEGTTYIQVRKTLARAPTAVVPRLQLISFQPRPPENPTENLTLTIAAPPRDTHFLANGQDKAKIVVFLSDPAPQPIKIDLLLSAGRFTPKPFQIPTGDFSAEGELTSDSPGIVTVTFLGSTPRLKPPETKDYQLTFKRPVGKVQVNAGWNTISLFESLDLTVSLLSADNQPVPTDKASAIEFTFGSGRGQIDPAHFTIPPGGQDGVAKFTPVWAGPVQVRARTINVDSGDAVSFRVAWPWESFILTALASVLCLAARNRRRGTPWTPWSYIAAGLGFLACWALVLSLVTLAPPRAFLNPVTPPILAAAIAWGVAAVAERRPFPIRRGAFRSRQPEPSEPATPILSALGVVDPLAVADVPEPETPAVAIARPIEIFFSYAREDEELRNQLADHMALMVRNKLVTLWHDRRIEPGGDWQGNINEHLKSADIILFLISSHFLASDYVNKVEVTLALERHRKGEARVIPVILRDADWQQPPLNELQALPTDGKPITSYENPDEGLREVAEAIRGMISSSHAVA